MKQQNLEKKGSCMAKSSMDLDNKLMICQIMQKFRPIAPKAVSSDENALSNGVVISPKKTGRIKRKYSRRKTSSHFKKKEEFVSEKSGSILDDEVVTTLQLLPLKFSESSEILKSLCSSNKSCEEDAQGDQVEEHTTLPKYPYGFLDSSSLSTLKEKVRVVDTWIIVECLTRVCMEFHNNILLGLSDDEKINHLQLDLNPCFVSDYLDKVVFVNEAYKKMVLLNHHEDMKHNFLENNHYDYYPREVKVELVIKEKIPNWFPKAFSCTARVIQSKWWRGQKEKFSRTIPCDVWRMEIGGFAWKLDIKTALGLGLY